MAIRPFARLLLAAFTFIGLPAWAQRPVRLLPHPPVEATWRPPLPEGPVHAPVHAPPAASPTKVSAINAPALGHAPNPLGMGVTETNCIHANDTSGVVVFIHRNDPNIFGGASGLLRYDVSTDRGLTWYSDIGPLNPANTGARYPSLAAYDPVGNTNPLSGRLIYMADNTNGNLWLDYVVGTSEITTSGTPATQDALFGSTNHTATTTMCEGLRGEYWRVSFDAQSNFPLNNLQLLRGNYSPGSQTITWANVGGVQFLWNLALSATPKMTSLNIAFSPDGQYGWVAGLGDLSGGRDSVYSPFLLRTTDAGATWSAPVEVDLNSYAWVYDSLRTLWTDSTGQPLSSGRATAAFQSDLTVDMNGNPHMFFTIGTAGDTPYSITIGPAMYMVDLSSTNQGQSFTLRTVAPAYTYRHGPFTAPELFDAENFPQASRSPDGSHIFFTWIDSDTALANGGVGFGNPWNNAPDLWASGLRISDGYTTCVVAITQGDLTWGGAVNATQCAPTVLKEFSGPSTNYYLPVVGALLAGQLTGDPMSYFYLGQSAVLSESMFVNAPGGSGTWPGCRTLTGIQAAPEHKDWVTLYPNPVQGRLRMQLLDGSEAPWTIALLDLHGRMVARSATMPSSYGELDLGGLAAGAYLYRIQGQSGVVQSGKLMVK